MFSLTVPTSVLPDNYPQYIIILEHTRKHGRFITKLDAYIHSCKCTFVFIHTHNTSINNRSNHRKKPEII